MSALTLKMMGSMVIGAGVAQEPERPADHRRLRGQVGQPGLSHYLAFLALISVSLGVLNLLPLPVLDGGHLMYYLWEAVTGRRASDAWMDRLQRGGVAILLVMMSLALLQRCHPALGLH